MRSVQPGRALSLALIVAAALTSSGCPELNRQPAKSPAPEFMQRRLDDEGDRQLAGPAMGRLLARQGSSRTRRVERV